MYSNTNKNDFGAEAECDLDSEKCKRLEVLARRVEKEKRKKDKPIIREKDVFEGFKDKKRKSKKMTNYTK